MKFLSMEISDEIIEKLKKVVLEKMISQGLDVKMDDLIVKTISPECNPKPDCKYWTIVIKKER